MSDMQTMKESGGTAETMRAHLLIPMDGTERSRWGIQYALRQRRAGKSIRVTLLVVAEPPDDWRILRFKTENEILRFQAECGKLLMEYASSSLRQAGIVVQSVVREGDMVFHILDAAEQCSCDEIVLPLPHSRLLKLVSVDVVREAMRLQREVPVLTVNSEGMPDLNWVR